MLIVPCKVADKWDGSAFFAAPGLVITGRKCCFGIHGDRWYLSFQQNGTTSVFSAGRNGAGGKPKVARKGFMPLMSALQDVGQAEGMACTLMRDRLLPLEEVHFDNDKDLPDHWAFLKPFLLGAGGDLGGWKLNRHIRTAYGRDYRVAGWPLAHALRVEGPENQWESMVRWAAERHLSAAEKQ